MLMQQLLGGAEAGLVIALSLFIADGRLFAVDLERQSLIATT